MSEKRKSGRPIRFRADDGQHLVYPSKGRADVFIPAMPPWTAPPPPPLIWHRRSWVADMKADMKAWACAACWCVCVMSVHASWWYMRSMSSAGSRLTCDNIPGLASEQRRLCRQHPPAVRAIGRGVRHWLSECRHQFRHRRWNCHAPARDRSLFGRLLLRGSREVAFIYAISSAGAVVALTRACDRGELDWCSRDETVGVADAFHWGGCSQHVELAARFGRAFVDAKERKRPDARSLINLHNNKVGREVVQRLLSLQCKCHGVSGSCSVRTCWLAMADFRLTGDRLRRKYERAVHVAVNQYGAALSTVGRAAPRDNQLVYSDRSPDFCVRDHDTGSAGTAGRRCDVTSRGVDGCSVLCCGRGYDTARVSRSAKCGCQFQWCCAVRCGDCRRTEDVRTCKEHTPAEDS